MTTAFDELEVLVKNVTEDFDRAKADKDVLIKLLERKVDINGRWKNKAEILNRKLDRTHESKFRWLPLFKDAFSEELNHLSDSAEEYLAQPEHGKRMHGPVR